MGRQRAVMIVARDNWVLMMCNKLIIPDIIPDAVPMVQSDANRPLRDLSNGLLTYTLYILI